MKSIAQIESIIAKNSVSGLVDIFDGLSVAEIDYYYQETEASRVKETDCPYKGYYSPPIPGDEDFFEI